MTSRILIEQMLAQWAQDHTSSYIVKDNSLEKTQGYLTWVIQEKKVNLDLVSLADHIELLILNSKNYEKISGSYCSKCKEFYEFAEPNQLNGTLICFSCRQYPFYK